MSIILALYKSYVGYLIEVLIHKLMKFYFNFLTYNRKMIAQQITCVEFVYTLIINNF